MKERIKKDQLLNENHFPLQIILNEISPNSFINTLNTISKGVGFGIDSNVCTFQNDLDTHEDSALLKELLDDYNKEMPGDNWKVNISYK